MFEKYDAIYVYGYNNWGRNVYNKIKALYPEKEIVLIISKNNIGSKSVYGDKNLLTLKDVIPEKNDLAIIGMSPVNREKIIENLRGLGFENILTYSHEIDDYLNHTLEKLPGLEIKLLAVSVGQACNLKCENCANFAPYAEKYNMRYPLEKVKADLDKALPLFSRIDTFHIQGGEPLLYSDLEELLIYTKATYGHVLKNIQIATNGTIIPSENVLKALKATNTSVRISNYPIASKADELKEILEKWEINYRVYNFVNRVGAWSDAGGLDYFIPKEKDVVRQVFECGWNACFTIENGLIGRCARSIPALKLQNIQMREVDYINLRNELDVKKVHKYFTITSPMACCRHCKGTTGEPIKPAIQMKKI